MVYNVSVRLSSNHRVLFQKEVTTLLLFYVQLTGLTIALLGFLSVVIPRLIGTNPPKKEVHK